MADEVLKGQRALVTGGNTGIGRAVAEAFAQAGADIAIAWFDREGEAQATCAAIRALGRSAIAIRCDVREENDVVALVDRAERELGALDVLVNNAGVQLAKPLIEMSAADWDRVQAVNVRGVFLCAREAAKRMIPRKRGAIINTCSQLAYLGRERYTAYSASKGAVVSLTRALARELAPHGIRVNGVGPGLIDTGFDPISAEGKARVTASIPLGRLGTTADVVSAYVYLASDHSRFFCGQVIHPNGGQVMH